MFKFIITNSFDENKSLFPAITLSMVISPSIRFWSILSFDLVELSLDSFVDQPLLDARVFSFTTGATIKSYFFFSLSLVSLHKQEAYLCTHLSLVFHIVWLYSSLMLVRFNSKVL